MTKLPKGYGSLYRRSRRWAFHLAGKTVSIAHRCENGWTYHEGPPAELRCRQCGAPLPPRYVQLLEIMDTGQSASLPGRAATDGVGPHVAS